MTDTADAAAAVRARQADIAIAVTSDYGRRFESAEPAALELFYDGTSSLSIGRADRIRRAVNAYGQQVADTRLLLRGITPDAVRPIEIKDRDISSASGRAGRLLAMLPIFLLVAAFTRGMSLAIDATPPASASVHRSESLLLQPVPAGAIVLGKWVTAATLSAASVGLMIAAMAALLALPQLRTIDLPIGLLVARCVVPCGRAASLGVARSRNADAGIAVLAPAPSEAQTQVSLLLLLPTVPGVSDRICSVGDSHGLRLLPIVSQQMMVGDAAVGPPARTNAVRADGCISLIATITLLWIAARLVAHERIVLGRTG